jgi:beta-galactosidase
MITSSAPGSLPVGLHVLRAAAHPPARYGESGGRSSAPSDAQIDEVAAVWRLEVPSAEGDDDRAELVIEWEGDVAQLRADGVVIRDRFWDGLPWRVDITALSPDAALTLHVVPITSVTLVDLDPAARARVEAAGSLCAVRSITRVVSARWCEEVG